MQLCFDFYMIEAKPENWIGDRAYDSDPLDEELRRDGIEMIAPHRTKPPTQDRRRLTRYMRRWLVERFFAWIRWQRRILVDLFKRDLRLVLNAMALGTSAFLRRAASSVHCFGR